MYDLSNPKEMNHIISHKKLTIETIKDILTKGTQIEIGNEAKANKIIAGLLTNEVNKFKL